MNHIKCDRAIERTEAQAQAVQEENDRLHRMVDEWRQGDGHEVCRAELAAWRDGDGTWRGLAFAYVNAEPGSDDCTQAWHELEAAVRSYEAVERRRATEEVRTDG